MRNLEKGFDSIVYDSAMEAWRVKEEEGTTWYVDKQVGDAFLTNKMRDVIRREGLRSDILSITQGLSVIGWVVPWNEHKFSLLLPSGTRTDMNTSELQRSAQ